MAGEVGGELERGGGSYGCVAGRAEGVGVGVVVIGVGRGGRGGGRV